MNLRSSKLLALASAAVLAAGLSSCGDKTDASSRDKISIVCTTFAEYDWTRQIAGNSDRVEITYLLGTGSDLHNYQPSAQDMLTISDCDMFVYVGGESDKWVDDALKEARNKDMKVIELMDILGDSAKEEELKEGMMPEEEEEEEEGPEYDEHVWLSLRNAQLFCAAICDDLAALDPDNAEMYRSGLESYTEQLAALDGQFTELIDSAPVKTIIFGDRFPFRYFCDDYGLDYYAAFVGCSAETEASFDTIITLAEKTDELNIDTIFKIEGSDASVAEAIIRNTKSKDQSIETLNSIQSVSDDEVAKGNSYIGYMEQNYDTLKKVLG